MTPVEFRLICGSNSDSDRFIARYSMSVVPLVGEGVNIDGYPYVVHERGWASGEEGTKHTYSNKPPNGTTWGFVRVVKLYAWDDPPTPKWSDEELAANPAKAKRAAAVEELGKNIQHTCDDWVDDKHSADRAAMLIVAVLPDQLREALAQRFKDGKALPPDGYSEGDWAAVEKHIEAQYGKKK